jgi:hypothetical protein
MQRGAGLLGPARLRTFVVRAVATAALVLGTGVTATMTGWSDAQVRSQLLLSLVMAHVALAFPSRAARHSFERGWARNRVLLAAVAASLGMQVLVFLTSIGRDVFDIAALPPVAWVLGPLAAAGALVLIELLGRAQGSHGEPTRAGQGPWSHGTGPWGTAGRPPLHGW